MPPCGHSQVTVDWSDGGVRLVCTEPGCGAEVVHRLDQLPAEVLREMSFAPLSTTIDELLTKEPDEPRPRGRGSQPPPMG